MPYIMELDYQTGWRLIRKARERQDVGKMWILYANMYPNFTKKNFIKFEDFYKTTTYTVSTRSVEDIMKDVDEIRNKMKKV